MAASAVEGRKEAAEPMAMTQALEDEIVTALRRIVRAIDLHSRRMVESCGLTGPQLAVLRAAARPSGSSVGALAREVSLGQPTVSGILDRLEVQELVRRERSTTDRRSVFVSVTPKGVQVLKRAPSLLEDRFRARLAQLEDWERTQTLASLQRLASMMDAESIDAAPLLETGKLVERDPTAGSPGADSRHPGVLRRPSSRRTAS